MRARYPWQIKEELKSPPSSMNCQWKRGGRGDGLRRFLGAFDVLAIEKALLNGFECRHPLRLSDGLDGFDKHRRLKANRVRFQPSPLSSLPKRRPLLFLQDRSRTPSYSTRFNDLRSTGFKRRFDHFLTGTRRGPDRTQWI